MGFISTIFLSISQIITAYHVSLKKYSFFDNIEKNQLGKSTSWLNEEDLKFDEVVGDNIVLAKVEVLVLFWDVP